MTDSDEPRVIPAGCFSWLATHPEWAPVPGARYYEASHRGFVRSLDRTLGGRHWPGTVLKGTAHKDGYRMATVTTDDGERVKNTVHAWVMLAHAGPCPAGLEVRHLNSDPADNRYCGCGLPGCTQGNMAYGSSAENHADMVAAGTAVVPESFECVNFERCGGTTRNPGRRCGACVEQVGRFAAQLLNAGMPSMEAAERFGYTDDRWLHRLAAEQGGYKGTRAEARTQSPTLLQRVQILGILRLARRAGLLRSDAA